MGCHRSRLPANAAAIPAAVYPRQPSARILGDLKVWARAAKILDDLKTWAGAESLRAQAEKDQARMNRRGGLYEEGREDAMYDLLDKIEELGREHG